MTFRFPPAFPPKAGQQIEPASLLVFHWRSDMLNAVSGQAATFNRSGPGGFVADSNGLLAGPHSEDRERYQVTDGVTGLLLVDARTNLISTDDLTAWDGASVVTLEYVDGGAGFAFFQVGGGNLFLTDADADAGFLTANASSTGARTIIASGGFAHVE